MKITWLVILIFLLFGCSTQLTKEGSDIRIVSDAESSECSSLGVVKGVESMGINMKGDRDSAMNIARNIAGELGANAIKIISVDTTDERTVVTAEALKCPGRSVTEMPLPSI